ncbi:hypothetical protein FAZ19_21105 [Sphingobacterium alkalisoli]|uniref:Uncharacterized protein n=1 Tax=Sphingobacterium alkalisoli TaxID=1874115 RepID=A0A4U0GR80_9SPHI|nr:hypothetical protein [Sphingobacterium alkalisoli]TJY61403.1 hypothetical protein FAZ19_21105 [Sphingobacterium alkalisoli]GGH30602.1 hypothetical protein GCM10011418_42790 [Sphingobacterium alkalisoli]
MQTIFIAGSGLLALALILFYLYKLQRRLQQYAQLRVSLLKREGNTHDKTKGSFMFYLKAHDSRLRQVVFTSIRFSDPALQVNAFDKLSFEVKAFNEELPARSIGFSCRSSALNRVDTSKAVLSIKGYVVVEKEGKTAFAYRTKVEMITASEALHS